MPNPTAAPCVHPPECWAEVRANDQVMRYRRSGSGRAVLVLLRAADAPEPLWPELADALAGALATQFRLIVPDVPRGGDVAAWLASFLEGLGADGVAVVAVDGFCVPAIELALLGAEQVARVVLVPGGEGGGQGAGLDGALGMSARAAAVPLLVVRRGLRAGDALSLVTRFLAGDGMAGVAATG